MPRSLTFFVPGGPTPQGSKRVFVNKKTGRANLVESAGVRLKDWRTLIKIHATLARRREKWPTAKGPVFVILDFHIPRPRSHYGTGRNADKVKPSSPRLPTSRRVGDGDKLTRAVWDGLTEAGVIADDSHITDWAGSKRYTRDRPGVLITVEPLKGPNGHE